MHLKKIVSGGQTGSDEAGLVVAKRFGLETGGIMPLGFKTLRGNRPEFASIYGITEHGSENYVPRTYLNVQNSDGTIRLAGNFNSRGELCTMKAILKFGKPCFDIDLADPPPESQLLEWLEKWKIVTLNVAGNAEETYAGAYVRSVAYLSAAFLEGGLCLALTTEQIVNLVGLVWSGDIVASVENGKLLLRKP